MSYKQTSKALYMSFYMPLHSLFALQLPFRRPSQTSHMFRKFTQEESLGSASKIKSSMVRAIKVKLVEQMPELEPLIPVLIPKKSPVFQVKSKDRISFVGCNGELLFFQQRDGPWFPTLRLLHKYPHILPHLQVDKGAIRFVLSGADIMCPGLTSPGAKMDVPVEADRAVAIMAEGKQHAVAIGLTKLSTDEIRSVNKDIGVLSVTYLNDGLWHVDPRPLNLH